jgi:pimeloyl-ACP methyl ester carboxylesterase
MSHTTTGLGPAIVYVHGAFASRQSMPLNYYKVNLKHYDGFDFIYDWNTPTDQVGAALSEFINTQIPNADVFVIGHSLGGNVALHSALHIAQHDIRNSAGHRKIKHIFTVGSPLGGSKAALLLKYGYNAPEVFSHITPNNPNITALRRWSGVPVTSFVTTKGVHSKWMQQNDGVVTVASQKAVGYPTYIEVDCGHMEVLLSDAVVNTISSTIQGYNET